MNVTAENTHDLAGMEACMAIPRHTNSFKPHILSQAPPALLSALAGMDVQGELILGTWLYGGGVDHEVLNDPVWSSYMMAHRTLAGQILISLKPAVEKLVVQKKLGTFPVVERFHAIFPENSDKSGYALLHGSNATVGDFLTTGLAEVQEAIDPADGNYDIDLDLMFVFNDIVDPNGNYWTDKVRSAVAKMVTPNSARNYRLSIGWTSKSLVEVRTGRGVNYYGYPSSYPIPVRPLPRSKLDVAGMEKRRAHDAEAKIIVQLQRKFLPGDVAGLADRKHRLLWLFYRLSGYWGATYLARISNPNDSLARLLKDRISGELRAEITQTLRGKRPPGAEPL